MSVTATGIIGLSYAIVALFCGLALFYIAGSFKTMTTSGSDDTYMFYAILYAALAAFADVGYGLYNYDYLTFNPTVAYIFYTSYTVLSLISGYYWLIFSERKQKSWLSRSKKHFLIVAIPYFICTLIAASSPFTHVFFSLSESGEYIRGPLYFPVFALPVLMYTVSGFKALILSFSKKHYLTRRGLHVVFMYTAGLLSIQALQIFLPSILPIRTMGMMALFGICLIRFAKGHIKTDALSDINNRFAFENYLNHKLQLETVFGVVLIDIDKFKSINDTYGHKVGDDAIRLAARSICKSVPSNCFVARIGGDEFVVVGTNDVVPFLNIEQRINENLAELLQQNNCGFTFTLSTGYMMIDSSYTNLPDVIAAVDKKLYQRKAEKMRA